MTCAACGLPACNHSDPVYAGVSPLLPAAAAPSTSSRPLAGGPQPLGATGSFVDDRASDGEADALGRQVQSVAVHGDRYAIDAVFRSSGKADNISGEAHA